MSNLINVDLLEDYYRSLIHKSAEGKDCVSIEVAEKIMLLEIYKALCTCNNNNVNDCCNGGGYAEKSFANEN